MRRPSGDQLRNLAPSVLSSDRITLDDGAYRWIRPSRSLLPTVPLSAPLAMASRAPSGDHSRSVGSRSGRTVMSRSPSVSTQTSLPAADVSGLIGEARGTPNASLSPEGDQTG